jgi:hypothetical protein
LFQEKNFKHYENKPHSSPATDMLRELAETIEAVASKIPFVLFLEESALERLLDS